MVVLNGFFWDDLMSETDLDGESEEGEKEERERKEGRGRGREVEVEVEKKKTSRRRRLDGIINAPLFVAPRPALFSACSRWA